MNTSHIHPDGSEVFGLPVECDACIKGERVSEEEIARHAQNMRRTAAIAGEDVAAPASWVAEKEQLMADLADAEKLADAAQSEAKELKRVNKELEKEVAKLTKKLKE